MRLQGSLIKETTSTEGTGAKTLLGAPAPYFTVGSLLTAGQKCTYLCRDSINAELVRGTYQTGPSRLTVDQVLKSTNGGLAVPWGPGTRDIYLVSVPEEAPETFIEEVVAVGAGTVDFTGWTSDYDDYVIRFSDVTVSIDGVQLNLRISQAGAFKSDAAYGQTLSSFGNSVNSASAGAATAHVITAAIDNVPAGYVVSGEVIIRSPGNGAIYKNISSKSQFRENSTNSIHDTESVGLYIGSTAIIDGARIFPGTGAVSGRFALFGRKRR